MRSARILPLLLGAGLMFMAAGCSTPANPSEKPVQPPVSETQTVDVDAVHESPGNVQGAIVVEQAIDKADA